MTGDDFLARNCGVLPRLPVGARLTLSAFLLLVGSGYLIAVVNIFYSHRLADGKEGLSFNDLRAVYAGLARTADEGGDAPSRMLTMLRGPMRQYAASDDNFRVLESWLARGASMESIDEGAGKATPRRVLLLDCMRCHAESSGTDISRKSAFGPDDFTLDEGLLSRFTSSAGSNDEGASAAGRTPPQYTMPRLILVTHQHMLAIPVFTLLVTALFMLTRVPPLWRNIIAPLPMLALVVDFSGWYLARAAEPFVYLITIAGGVFGAAFGFQVLAVLIDLWRPSKRSEPSERSAGL